MENTEIEEDIAKKTEEETEAEKKVEYEDETCPECGRLLIHKYRHHYCPGAADGCVLAMMEEERGHTSKISGENIVAETGETEGCGDDLFLSWLQRIDKLHQNEDDGKKKVRALDF